MTGGNLFPYKTSLILFHEQLCLQNNYKSTFLYNQVPSTHPS